MNRTTSTATRRKRIRLPQVLLTLCVLSAPALAQSAPAHGPLEITSRLGRPLYALPDDPSIAAARKALAADPKNPTLLLALSKAQAGRRQYKEAVATSTEAIQLAPNNADLYLERGHRELGLRDFQAARKDLEQAVHLAPTMLDAHYHLALSHYFLGEFDQAATHFAHARDLAKSDDSLIDCTNWLYVSLRRANQPKTAAAALAFITPAIKNTEPHLYFYLRLLHFYQGKLTAAAILPPPPTGPSDIEGELSFDTVNYGVANWHLYNGDPVAATPLFQRVVKGEAWNAWGFIGSEVELTRH